MQFTAQIERSYVHLQRAKVKYARTVRKWILLIQALVCKRSNTYLAIWRMFKHFRRSLSHNLNFILLLTFEALSHIA